MGSRGGTVGSSIPTNIVPLNGAHGLVQLLIQRAHLQELDGITLSKGPFQGQLQDKQVPTSLLLSHSNVVLLQEASDAYVKRKGCPLRIDGVIGVGQLS